MERCNSSQEAEWRLFMVMDSNASSVGVRSVESTSLQIIPILRSGNFSWDNSPVALNWKVFRLSLNVRKNICESFCPTYS